MYQKAPRACRGHLSRHGQVAVASGVKQWGKANARPDFTTPDQASPKVSRPKFKTPRQVFPKMSRPDFTTSDKAASKREPSGLYDTGPSHAKIERRPNFTTQRQGAQNRALKIDQVVIKFGPFWGPKFVQSLSAICRKWLGDFGAIRDAFLDQNLAQFH